MARDPQILIFVGIKDTVLAIDDRTGAEMWRTELHTADYVTVLWDGEALLAANAGEVWRLDPKGGQVMWHNELKGLGRGIVSLSSSRRPSTSSDTDMAAKRRADAAAAAAAASAG
jgi:outer membrane protein assembly factor BamB